ncbi:unnamed protein product [Mytilus edulis]|uniref:Integrase catalytic domain-containing protein n=1 Tax=Mytilus edulis TaxID=6550 RepID=A0A8S3V1S2_MYTED|nr:unnamed protein product [Mytilus edulis]
MWNKTPMKPIGEVHLKLINPKNGDETMATLVVVPNGHMNLLGLETIRRMGLITVNDDRFIAKVETQKIGDLGEITLKVDENVPAKTLPSRKLPLSLQDDVKKEIDKLVERRVLIPVTEPSKWLTEALGDIEGVFTIADDIIVAGCGRTNEEALIDNDRKLKKLFQRCNDYNILLNEEKKEVGLTEITYTGCPTARNKNSDRDTVPYCALPYFEWRDELSIQENIIVKGEAILIPKALRKEMKNRLHSAHLGYDSMMRRARGTIFWPGMAKEIKQMTELCEICQESKPKNQREPLIQHSDGQSPWAKIGMDLFEIKGRPYLVVIDYFSNFTEVDYLSKTTSSQVITILKKQFARFGIPKTIVSDNGPQFSSDEFRQFATKWGINHTVSSPNHPQGNGKAESAVKVIKNMIKKTLQDGRDQYEALLELRNTPTQKTGLSPTEIMFGRKTRSMIPSINTEQKVPNAKTTESRSTRKQSVKKCYDKRAKNLPPLGSGDSVYFEHKQGQHWKLGKVKERLSERAYIVKSQEGVPYRRNRSHMRPTSVNVQIRDVSPQRELLNFDNISETKTSVPTEAPITAELQMNSDNLVSECEPIEKEQKRVNPITRPKRTTREPAYLKDYVL